MPKIHADDIHFFSVESLLEARPHLAHLRPRKYGDTIVLESGTKRSPVPHARFRRVTKQWWNIEICIQPGHWDVLPDFRGQLGQALELLDTSFPWVLVPRD